MVFAAPSAMWLYCTGTVFRERARLLTTQKEGAIERNNDRESEKASKEERGGESREIIKREGEINKQSWRLSALLLVWPYTLSLSVSAWLALSSVEPIKVDDSVTLNL